MVLAALSISPISFALHNGEKVQLRGQNGSGKSTLLRAIQNHSHVQSGDIFKLGASLYLDQNFSLLNPELNAVHNLQLLNPCLSNGGMSESIGATSNSTR